MNPIEILPTAARGAIVARETRESGGGADGSAEAFAALLEALSGDVPREGADAGPDAEGEAGEVSAIPVVEPDAVEVAEGAGAVVLPAAAPAEGQQHANVEASRAIGIDADPAQPVAKGREADAPMEPSEAARQGMASRVAEALWNAVFGIVPAVQEGEVQKPLAGEVTAPVATRAGTADLQFAVAMDRMNQAGPPARTEQLQMTGPAVTAALEDMATREPLGDRAEGQAARPSQAGAMLAAPLPLESVPVAARPVPETDVESGGSERSDPAGRGGAVERVAPVLAPAVNPAAPASSAAVQASAMVEVAASQSLEGWRLEAEPGARTTAAEAAAAARPMPPAQQIVAQLTVAIQRAPGDRVEIRLDPPELGRVQIELSSRDGVLHAVVTSERPEVHDLMRRHAEMLRQELAAAGHAGVRLDFANGSGQGERGRDAEEALQVSAGDRGQAGTAAPAPVEAPINRRPRQVGDRLDIRL
jgi:flagellar hook-length control protein FliK